VNGEQLKAKCTLGMGARIKGTKGTPGFSLVASCEMWQALQGGEEVTSSALAKEQEAGARGFRGTKS